MPTLLTAQRMVPVYVPCRNLRRAIVARPAAYVQVTLMSCMVKGSSMITVMCGSYFMHAEVMAFFL